MGDLPVFSLDLWNNQLCLLQVRASSSAGWATAATWPQSTSPTSSGRPGWTPGGPPASTRYSRWDFSTRPLRPRPRRLPWLHHHLLLLLELELEPTLRQPQWKWRSPSPTPSTGGTSLPWPRPTLAQLRCPARHQPPRHLLLQQQQQPHNPLQQPLLPPSTDTAQSHRTDSPPLLLATTTTQVWDSMTPWGTGNTCIPYIISRLRPSINLQTILRIEHQQTFLSLHRKFSTSSCER